MYYNIYTKILRKGHPCIMSTKSAMVNIRVSPEVKQQVSDIYKDKYGITLTQAINIFFHKTIDAGGLPFEIMSKDNGTGSNG